MCPGLTRAVSVLTLVVKAMISLPTSSVHRIWSVSAHATIKLVNQANPEKSYSKGTDTELCDTA